MTGGVPEVDRASRTKGYSNDQTADPRCEVAARLGMIPRMVERDHIRVRQEVKRQRTAIGVILIPSKMLVRTFRRRR